VAQPIKRQLMAEQWDQFARQVLHPQAPAIQKQEMRRAFYAGAQAILFRVIQALAPESEPTAEDLQVMQDLEDELQAFGKAIKEGRA